MNIKHLLTSSALGLLTLSFSSLSAHTWTSAEDGATITGDFVSLEDGTLTLSVRGDVELSYSLDQFTAEDQELARAYASGEIQPATGLNVKSSVAGQLVRVQDGEWVPTEIEGEPDYYLIMFSASWCGPCRASAPASVERYNQVITNLPNFEMIWVTGDRSAAPMLDWANNEEFPWPTLAFEHTQGHPLTELSAGYYPYYAVIDKNGNKLAEGNNDINAFIQETIAPQAENAQAQANNSAE